MLRILDRHILREFLLYLVLGMVTFVGIFLIVDLFEKLDTFVDHKAALHDVLAYYGYGLPLIVVEVLPVALLLAAILSLGHLRKFNEISAMQSCGLSPVRITRPLLAIALLLSAGAYALSEGVVPGAYEKQKETMDVKIKNRRPTWKMGRQNVRYMGRSGRIYVADRFTPSPPTLIEVSIQRYETAGSRKTMRGRIDAARAVWKDGFWEAHNGFARVFAGNEETAAAFVRYGDTRMEEQPDEFAQPESDPFHMSRRDLADYIRRIREGGAQVNQYEVDYHLRLAFPFANLIMVLLGTCLSLRIVRGTVALGFGISISLGFAYYGFLRLGQALGYNGKLPPLLAAWLGNIVFGIVGTILFRKLNR